MNNIRFGQWAFNMDLQQTDRFGQRKKTPTSYTVKHSADHQKSSDSIFYMSCIEYVTGIDTKVNELHCKGFSRENTRDLCWSIIQPGILLMRIFQRMLQSILLCCNNADFHIHTHKYTYIYFYIYLFSYILHLFIYFDALDSIYYL